MDVTVAPEDVERIDAVGELLWYLASLMFSTSLSMVETVSYSRFKARSLEIERRELNVSLK